MPHEARDHSLVQRARLDEDRIARVRTGDERAFEDLFRSYAEPLCRFADSYLNDPEAAKEVVQDLFLWIWKNRFTLVVPRSVRGYLHSATRNRALNELRAGRTAAAFRERMSIDADGDASAPPPIDAEIDAAALDVALHRAIRELPSRCREVFVLARERLLTYREIAEVLSIAPKTVEIHMSRSLAELRLKLAEFRNR